MAIHLAVLHIFLLAIAIGASFAQTSRKELKTKEMNQDKIISKDQAQLSKSIDPSQVIRLSWQPRVFLYRGFLSDEECDYLISRVHGKKRNSTRSSDLTEVQMKDGLSLEADEADETARRIEERIYAWTFLPKEYSKSLRVLHFGPEDSKTHNNFLHKNSTEQLGERLLATVILYLSNVSQGGQILFPESESKVWSDCTKSSDILRPSRGNAILFFNQHLNATPDNSSSHARCPVLDDEMWCATKFFYLKSIGSEHNLSRSDYPDCTDEEINCPAWASVGECQRNPVFMIGSPDYYGACRKSCNSC